MAVRNHGLYWWPEGFYRHQDYYSFYFKKPSETSHDFYLMKHETYDEAQLTEARGTVLVKDRRVLIDVEYKDAKGRWRKASVNGAHKIDRLFPDDLDRERRLRGEPEIR
jgi:hypothetical protein